MKHLSLAILLLLLTSMKIEEDKKKLLCHKWIQFATKAHTDAAPKPIAEDIVKECVFKKSGYYEEIQDEDMVMATGQWLFSPDKKKMKFHYATLNAQHIPPLPESADRFDIIILKLTKDTLIYGKEIYNEKGETTGHDDLYFVKED
jgi:hypothetical protein